jgi:uracil-DNA glycosylase
MSSTEIDEFVRLLKNSPAGAVFNPWWDIDEQNDAVRNAPVIRRNQLRAYLQKPPGSSKLTIVGEALGYRGGHFTGIPMTSERILLSKQKDIAAALCERPNISGDGCHSDKSGLQILSGIKPRQTSKPQKHPNGFSEPTATVVWGALLKLGLLPTEFVLWNAFPWHSFDPRRGMLSNRMPNNSERAAGLPVLEVFLELFPCNRVVALGKIADAQLEQLGANACCIRHPASGGAKLFRQQIAKIVKRQI